MGISSIATLSPNDTEGKHALGGRKRIFSRIVPAGKALKWVAAYW
jgi:hypothetical protein